MKVNSTVIARKPKRQPPIILEGYTSKKIINELEQGESKGFLIKNTGESKVNILTDS